MGQLLVLVREIAVSASFLGGSKQCTAEEGNEEDFYCFYGVNAATVRWIMQREFHVKYIFFMQESGFAGCEKWIIQYFSLP